MKEVMLLSAHEPGKPDQPKEWYSPRELFDKMYSLGVEIGGLRVDLAETKTQIRDYNGLRQDVEKYCRETVGTKVEIQGLKAEIQGAKSEIQGLRSEAQGLVAVAQGLRAEKQGAKASWGAVHNIIVILIMLGAVMVAVFKH